MSTTKQAARDRAAAAAAGPAWGVAWTDPGPGYDSRLRCEECHRSIYYTHEHAQAARRAMVAHLLVCLAGPLFNLDDFPTKRCGCWDDEVCDLCDHEPHEADS
jgi:hypothetical protein